MAIRVHLAGDHTMFREGLEAILSSREGIEVVGSSSTGEEAAEQIRKTGPEQVGIRHLQQRRGVAAAGAVIAGPGPRTRAGTAGNLTALRATLEAKPQETTKERRAGVRHEAFAERSGRRLEETAERLEGGGRDLGVHGGASGTRARAGELRVAALLVRGEAEAVSAAEASPAEVREDPARAPPLRAQA